MREYTMTLFERVDAMRERSDELWETNPDGANYFDWEILAPEEEALANALKSEAEYTATH